MISPRAQAAAVPRPTTLPHSPPGRPGAGGAPCWCVLLQLTAHSCRRPATWQPFPGVAITHYNVLGCREYRRLHCCRSAELCLRACQQGRELETLEITLGTCDRRCIVHTSQRFDMAPKRHPGGAWRQLLLGVLLGAALTATTLRHGPWLACGESSEGLRCCCCCRSCRRHRTRPLAPGPPRWTADCQPAPGRLQPPAPLVDKAAAEPTLQRRDPPPPPPPLPLPWEPLLTPQQLARGLSFFGGGRRMERVGARLIAGEAITAVTIGASVTRGHGASSVEMRFPHRWSGVWWSGVLCCALSDAAPSAPVQHCRQSPPPPPLTSPLL